MEWTFDPLEIKNAYFNIEKLGAIARRYNVNQYGITSSPLQGGLPTDRLVAEWWLKSDRVRCCRPGQANFEVVQTITVPGADLPMESRSRDAERARQVQAEIRDSFSQAFSQGSGGAGLRARRGEERQISAGIVVGDRFN